MKCIYCKQDITWKKNENGRVAEARYKMIAVDRPYVNLFFHKDCYETINENLVLYLTPLLESMI